MKKIILNCGLVLLVAGCSVNDTRTDNNSLADLDNCSSAYQQSFNAAVKANTVEFCLSDTPDPQFIQDGLGGYCFMPHSADPADFSTLHETSFVTDCVDMFAQATRRPASCAILQNSKYPSSGVGATAYNTCIIHYASFTADLTVCDQLEQTENDPFGLPDEQECIKAVQE